MSGLNRLARLCRLDRLRVGTSGLRPAPGFELFMVRKPGASGWEPIMVRKPDHSGFESFQVKRNG